MSSSSDLLKSIRESENGLTLAELLSAHTGIARRTAQRLIAKLIENHQVSAMGEGCLTSTILTARRQLFWPVEAGNELNSLFT